MKFVVFALVRAQWLVVIGVFTLFLTVFQARATIDVSLQMQLGNPSNATADTNNHSHFLIQRTVEAIDYSDNLGEPTWASWDLTADDLGGSGRNSSFYTDTNLPPNFNWVTTGDYTYSGYDRGHMCPSADRTDTTNDNKLVFYMSNIVPQDSINNSGVWGQFESYCRAQAQTNELLIICGPSGFGGARINTNGPVYIPDYVWKIAVVVPLGGGTATDRITSSTRVIALKIPNTDAATNSWPYYVTSASQIQVDTGLTFFTALDPGIAAVLRNEVDGQTNPPPVIYSFSPGDGDASADVVITGTNFASVSAVTFNGAGAAFNVDSDTQITTVVPTNGSSGFISVTTPSGTAISTNSFVVDGVASVYNGILVGWDVSGLTNNGAGNYGPSPLTATTNASNLTTVGLTRGSGVTQSGSGAARGWGGTGFTGGDATTAAVANQFATFNIAANNGYKVSFSSVSRFDYRRSGTGPTNGVLQYQLGSGLFNDITNLNYSSTSSSGSSIGAIDLSGFAALQNVGAGTNVTFRIVNYGGTSSGGTWYVFDTAGSSAPDLALFGTVTSVITLTPVQSWRLQWFGTTNNTGIAADTYAGTSDGMPNLLKYALGLNPLVATNNPVVGDISTGHLRLTAPRNPNATDVTFSGIVSGDLITWTTNDTVVDQNTPTVFQIHDGVPVTGGTNRFIRLRITQP
jgi:DNA/RNA endonuclease G (NUC1)